MSRFQKRFPHFQKNFVRVSRNNLLQAKEPLVFLSNRGMFHSTNNINGAGLATLKAASHKHSSWTPDI